jgi:hypothetical protein
VLRRRLVSLRRSRIVLPVLQVLPVRRASRGLGVSRAYLIRAPERLLGGDAAVRRRLIGPKRQGALAPTIHPGHFIFESETLR